MTKSHEKNLTAGSMSNDEYGIQPDGLKSKEIQEEPSSNKKGQKNPSFEFSDLNERPQSRKASSIEFILDIPLDISVELGRTNMMINELLKLGQGSIIELPKIAGETLDIRANQKMIAKGEVISINQKYGIRLTEIISPADRIEKLK